MDILGFDSGYGKDQARASYENDQLDNLAADPQGRHPVRLECDNDDIHIEVHESRMKEPSFEELPGEVQMAYAQHVAEHKQAKDEIMHQQMMQAAMMGIPPQPPGPNPMQAQEKIKQGQGPSTKMQNAMNPDLTGGGIGSRG
jgi:hypothetical protein